MEEREKDLEDQAGDLDAGTIEEDLVSSLCANLEENISDGRCGRRRGKCWPGRIEGEEAIREPESAKFKLLIKRQQELESIE